MDKARLKAIPLFADLAEDDLNTIATFAEETSVGPGEVLVREGDFSAELIAIEEGSAEVEHEGKVVATLGPGDYFGEVALAMSVPRTASVLALTPAVVASCDKQTFDEFLRPLFADDGPARPRYE